MEMFTTIVISLLSALISSFLAAYLTYCYTEKSWRRHRHFEDIKMNCLKEILRNIEEFEDLFRLSEDRISTWVRGPGFQKGPPSSAWCKLFSFGFDEPPTTHYRVLLHDLKSHFPDLVSKLKNFEDEMRKLCPRYNERRNASFERESQVHSRVKGEGLHL